MKNRHHAVDALVCVCDFPNLFDGSNGEMDASKQLSLRRRNDLVGVAERSKRVCADGVRHGVADAQGCGDDRGAEHQPHRDEDALGDASRHISRAKSNEEGARPREVSEDCRKDEQNEQQTSRKPKCRDAKEILHVYPRFTNSLCDWCPGQDSNLYALADSRF